MKKLEEIYLANRKEWRQWLKDNHGRSDGVWLIFFKQDTGKPRISYDDAVEEALCFGWIDSLIKKIDKERYCRKFTPRQAKSSWSDLNKLRIEKLERAGLMMPAGEKAVRAARENGSWDRKIESRKKLNMPGELLDVLSRSTEAHKFYHSLTRHQQRAFAGWIDTAKRPETRRRRAAEALQMLRRKEKLGMK